MRPRSATAFAVALALTASAPASAQQQGGFAIKAPHGSVRDLVQGRLHAGIHCPADCTVAARVIVAAKDARGLGLPAWETNQLLAVEGDTDTFTAGDHQLGFQIITPRIQQRLEASLLFPLFSTVLVKVEAQADFDQGGSATPSVTSRLFWPSVADQNGGRGNRGIVRSISGPSSVGIGAKAVAFEVRLRRSAPTSTVKAGVITSGDVLSTTSFGFYDGRHKAGPAALRRGGTFTLRVPANDGNLRQARDLAPLSAEVFVDVIGTATGKVRDHGIRRFTLAG